MLKEKLYAYMGGKTEREKQLEAEMRQTLKELNNEKKQVIALVKSDGWKLIEKYLNKKIEAVHLALEKCEDEKEMWKLQNEIKTIKGVFGFLNSKMMMSFDKK